jgi:hypothetical protein
MRVGKHPARNQPISSLVSKHRIVVPVHIPNHEGFYEQALDVLKICLNSIIKTITPYTRITIFSDDSSPSVERYLIEMQEAHSAIDQLFLSRQNIGKINSIFAAVRSNRERFLTVADCDVYFRSGWQHEIESIFEAFPEAGMVSPHPVTGSGSFSSWNSSSTVLFGLTRRCVRFSDVEDPDSLNQFNESIGRSPLSVSRISKQMTLTRNGKTAVVGAGHFVATYRSSVFKFAPNEPCEFKMGGASEANYLDSPVNDAGYLRLSTQRGFVRHLGNTLSEGIGTEPQEFSDCQISCDMNEKSFEGNGKPLSAIEVFVGKIFNRTILKNKSLRHQFQKLFGVDDLNY